jgi:PGF-pre-PGF domain-containing protein
MRKNILASVLLIYFFVLISMSVYAAEESLGFGSSVSITVIDNPPTWFNNTTSLASGSQYLSGQVYQFNITWSGLTHIFFESNYTLNASESGNLTNYSSNNITNSSGVFSINLTDLPVQTFVYRWLADDNGGNWNSSPALNFTINKGTLNLSINFTPSDTVLYGNQTTAMGIDSNGGDTDVNYTLYRDSVLKNDTAPYTDTATLAAGTYTYLFNATGGANWTANPDGVSSVLTIQTPSDAPFVPGPGSGEIPVVTTVIRDDGKANLTIKSLSSGKTVNITILKTEDLAIRKISVSAANNVNNVMIRIKKMQGIPSTIPFEINGKVYNYISIEKENISDSDISKAIIRFAVTRQWMTDNNVDYRNISLYRWESNNWNELPTNYSSNDTIEILFEAVSPGFSTFAIGVSGSETAPVEESQCTELWSCSSWSECSDGIQTRTCIDINNCGTYVTKPSESQECGATEADTEFVAGPFPFFEVSIIIVIAIAAIVLVVLEMTGKIHLGSLRGKETKTKYVYSSQGNKTDDEFYRKKDSDDEEGS